MNIKIPFIKSPSTESGIASSVIDLQAVTVKNADYGKYIQNRQYFHDGIGNSLLFQKCSHFNWPYWLQYAIGRAEGGMPLLLNNDSCRSWMRMTNLISSAPVYVDPSGMVVADSSRWALEFWIVDDTDILRPDVKSGNSHVWLDTEQWSAHSSWICKKNKLDIEYFITRTSIDELIIHPHCAPAKTSGNLFMLMVIRPYNMDTIGGVHKIEYKPAGNMVSVNGRDCLCLQENPHLVETGNAESGDIRFSRGSVDTLKVTCDDGMATMAVGYKIDKKGPLPPVRLAISTSSAIKKGTIDIHALRKDYGNYTDMRLSQGITIAFPDKNRVKRFKAARLGVLQGLMPPASSDKNYYKNLSHWREFFYTVYALNRMGYFNESLTMLRSFSSNHPEGKVKDLSHGVILAYLLSAVSDYYLHSRNSDFLQEFYPVVKKNCVALLEYTKGLNIKKAKKMSQWDNTHPYYFIKGLSGYDVSLFAYAFSQSAYLARSMGIFGDENRYIKESLRIGEIFNTFIQPESKSTMEEAGSDIEGKGNEDEDVSVSSEGFRPVHDYQRYDIGGVFPFTLGAFGREWLQESFFTLKKWFGNSLQFSQVIPATDMVASLLYANAMLYANDPDVIELLHQVEKVPGDMYVIPEYMNPSTGMSVYGDGASLVAMSLFSQLFRNLLFIDYSDRLELFPVPPRDWFVSGKEITVENAPSRFGTISFKMVATRGEVKITFLQLPQFVPPEIMIRLPFKAKIVQEDDFVIKKEMENAFLLNGWPDTVRFRR